MPRNIEIKARVDDLSSVEARVLPLATAGPTPLVQDDSFFHCARGRLKLRVFADGSGELIAYTRADAAGPKTSTYTRVLAPDPPALREALAAACGLRGRVRKRRTLYLVGRTRVHLDAVEALGSFVELEVVLADGEAEADGIAEAQALMKRLGIAPAALIDRAYVDLLDAAAPDPDAGAGVAAR